MQKKSSKRPSTLLLRKTKNQCNKPIMATTKVSIEHKAITVSLSIFGSPPFGGDQSSVCIRVQALFFI